MLVPALILSGTQARAEVSSERMEPAQLGLLLFIAMETMLFAGLISAFVVFRFSPMPWPPAGQPRLPLEVTAANSLILLWSGFTLQWAFQYLKEGNPSAFLARIQSTAWLGSIFLAVQGFEWVRLLHFGFNASSGVFAGFFYVLVGLHGVHVAGGLSAILWLWAKARRRAGTREMNLGAWLCRTYWFFVVGLWPILFGLIYF